MRSGCTPCSFNNVLAMLNPPESVNLDPHGIATSAVSA